MIPLLTISLVLLAVGLTLMIIAFSGSRNRKGEPPVEGAEAAPPRRLRPIPLIIGVLLAIAGGAGATVILNGDPDRFDKMVLALYPADRLVDDLNSMETLERQNAFHELTRRYKEGKLPEGAHKRLVARAIAGATGDRTAPDAPAINAPIVDVDIVAARRQNLLSAQGWGAFVARSAPLRLDVPRQVEFGKEIALRTDTSLPDPLAPAWIIIKVEELKIGDVAIDSGPAIAVAANPKWEPPPPRSATGAIDIDGAAPAGAPPVLRRVVRYPYTVPAEVLAGLGQGNFPVTGKILVFAFDSAEVAPPLELMNDAATGIPRRQRSEEDLVAVALSAQLTPEQFEKYRASAHGTHSWPVDRQIRIGDPPPQQPPAQQGEQAAEPQSEAGGE